MRLNSPQINLIIKACLKASRSLIRDFGEIENLQVSMKIDYNFGNSVKVCKFSKIQLTDYGDLKKC